MHKTLIYNEVYITSKITKKEKKLNSNKSYQIESPSKA